MSGKKKPININILGGTVFGTNRNRPWDKRDPSPGQIGNRPWDKPAFFCLIPQSPFVPFVPGTGGGSSLRRLSPKGRQLRKTYTPQTVTLQVTILLPFAVF